MDKYQIFGKIAIEEQNVNMYTYKELVAHLAVMGFYS